MTEVRRQSSIGTKQSMGDTGQKSASSSFAKAQGTSIDERTSQTGSIKSPGINGVRLSNRNISPMHGPPRAKKTTTRATVLPSILSDASKKSKEMMAVNYVLDIDSHAVSSRQHSVRLNNYYKRIINQRIFKSVEPSPLLKNEKAKLMQQLQINTQRLEQSRNQEMYLNQVSLVDQRGLASDATPLKSIQRDDSIFNYDKSEQIKLPSGLPSINDRFAGTQFQSNNKDVPTQAATSRDYQNQESYLQASLRVLDPLAGNSVVTTLNASVRSDARMQIDYALADGLRQRSRLRRKRELAGEEEIQQAKADNDFKLKGVLEDMGDQSDNAETETLANSSIYNMLQDDMEVFNEQYSTKKKVKEQIRLEKNAQKIAELEKSHAQAFFDDKTALDDPDAHFKKLKAKIKLNAVKQYQEDKQKRIEEEKKLTEPIVEIRDRFGRVMEKKTPLLVTKKEPNARRPPRKVKPVKRKMSFSDAQLQYLNMEEMHDPMANYPKPTLTEQYTIKQMKEKERWPVPESLLIRKKKDDFTLYIDSLISNAYSENSIKEWATFVPEIDAPYNSLESADEYSIGELTDSEEEGRYIKTNKARGGEDGEDERKFDMEMLCHNPFRPEAVRQFPYRSREGDVHVKLLKIQKVSYLAECATKILAQQKDERWDKETLQAIFEHFCIENKAAPMDLLNFIDTTEPSCHKLSIKNYQIDDSTMKSIAMVLPHILDIQELELHNNQITDLVSGMLLFGCFANPHIKRITIAYNYMRSTFTRTFHKLVKEQPEKITDMNTMGSIGFVDNMEPLIQVLPKLTNLTFLNIAGCGVSQHTCRSLSQWIITSYSIRILNVSHCKINFQGTRYIIDALNRNTTVRNFNFSFNDLSSATYEFSIKVASMLTRHPCLQHLDISNTNFKREEVMFITISLAISKTMLSLHTTASGVTYYDRIFMRAVIAARVRFPFKNLTSKKEVKSNKERSQLLQMASGECQDVEMHRFVDNMRELDEKREGLDVEIQDMLIELDTQATFADVKEDQTLEDVKDSKINTLVNKLIERQKEMDAQQAALKDAYSNQSKSIKDQLDVMAGIQEFAEFNLGQFGKKEKPESQKDEQEEDVFMLQKEMKVERQRQRAEAQMIKEGKDRSAGELALMFMGINQVAYELLAENPMTGYMNELVFSRVLGHDDIEEGTYWTDTTQCWVCDKHNKVEITYHLHDDREIFGQKVNKLESLHLTVNRCVTDGYLRDQAQMKAKMINDEEVAELVAFAGQDERDVEDDLDADSWIEDIQEVPEELEGGTKMTKSIVTGFGKSSGLKMTGLKSFRNTQMQRSTGTQNNQTLQQNSTPQKRKHESDGNKMMNQTMTDGNMTKVFEKERSPDQNIKEAKSAGDEQSIPQVTEHTESVNLEAIKEKNVQFEEQSQKTEIEEVPKPHTQAVDNTNPMNPVKTTTDVVKKVVFPDNFSTVKTFKPMEFEPIEKKDYTKIPQKPTKHNTGDGLVQARSNLQITGLGGTGVSLDAQNLLQMKFMQQRSNGNTTDDNESIDQALAHQTSVISTHEMKRRQHGEPVIIQRQVFFQGAVYVINEELYSDSDHSSVYTSEDDFEIDKGLAKRFKEENPLVSMAQLTTVKDEDDTMKDGFNKAFKLYQTDQQKMEDNNSLHDIKNTTLTSILKNKTPNAPNEDIKNQLDMTPKQDGEDDNMRKTMKSVTIDASNIRGAEDDVSANGEKKEAGEEGEATIEGGEKDQTADKKTEDGESPDKAPPKNVLKNKNSTLSQRNQALKKDHYANDPDLTEAQKRYESKLLPKHYKPDLAQARINALDDKSEMGRSMRRDSHSPKKAFPKYNHQGSMKGNTRTTLTDGFKPTEKEIFVVASFNDWMPMRMKTLRTLNLERFSMDQGANQVEVPRAVYMLDNTVALYANMVPPGTHYFYLVRNKGRIFLSPHYDVVRFKNTKIYLNKIVVGKRSEDVQAVHQAKDGEEDEAVFMKDRSVFKEFREDTQQYLQKCFEEDMQFSKIRKLMIKRNEENSAEYEKVKDTLFNHYVRITNIFLWQIGHSSYPTISMNDWASFSNRCKLVDQSTPFNLSAMDIAFVATCVANHSYKNNAERDLNRYEFLEIILRIANAKFRDLHICKDTAESIEKLLADHIYPNSKQMDGDHFRKYFCYNVKVNEVLKKNELQLKKVYESHTHAKKRFITSEECQSFCHKVGLHISDVMIRSIYAESMMTIIDTVRDPTRPNQMKYVEFVVFICRICHEHYMGSVYEKELLYIKIDQLMPKLLEPNRLAPMFSFGAGFDYDLQQEVRKLKRRKKKLQKAIEQQGKLNEYQEKELKDVEQQLRKTGMSQVQSMGSMGALDVQESSSEGEQRVSQREALLDDNGEPIVQTQEVDEDGNPINQQGEGEEQPAADGENEEPAERAEGEVQPDQQDGAAADAANGIEVIPEEPQSPAFAEDDQD